MFLVYSPVFSVVPHELSVRDVCGLVLTVSLRLVVQGVEVSLVLGRRRLGRTHVGLHPGALQIVEDRGHWTLLHRPFLVLGDPPSLVTILTGVALGQRRIWDSILNKK